MPLTPAPLAEEVRSRTRLIVAIALLVALVGLAAAWSLTPLARVFDPLVLASYEREARAWRFAPLVVVALYIAAGFVAAPATLMIGATALVFGAWPGSAYAFLGMMCNGIVMFLIARYAARDLVEQWLARRPDSRLDAFNRRLARRGFLAMVLMRLTPLPYTAQNVLAGGSGIRIADFVFGTAIGILPVIAVMAGIATEFDAWLAHPDWTRLVTLVAVAIALIAGAWSLRRWATRQGVDR